MGDNGTQGSDRDWATRGTRGTGRRGRQGTTIGEVNGEGLANGVDGDQLGDDAQFTVVVEPRQELLIFIGPLFRLHANTGVDANRLGIHVAVC